MNESTKPHKGPFKNLLYFLNFETFQQAIPLYDGVLPYMQIPFQYSLHAQQSEYAELDYHNLEGIHNGREERQCLHLLTFITIRQRKQRL